MDEVRYALAGGSLGFLYGSWGYLKNVEEFDDDFRWKKFVPDVLVSAGVGALIGFTQRRVPSEQVVSEWVAAPAAVYVNKLLKKVLPVLWRRFK